MVSTCSGLICDPFTFHQIISPNSMCLSMLELVYNGGTSCCWMWWNGSLLHLCLFDQMSSSFRIILSFVSGGGCPQESRQVMLPDGFLAQRTQLEAYTLQPCGPLPVVYPIYWQLLIQAPSPARVVTIIVPNVFSNPCSITIIGDHGFPIMASTFNQIISPNRFSQFGFQCWSGFTTMWLTAESYETIDESSWIRRCSYMVMLHLCLFDQMSSSFRIILSFVSGGGCPQESRQVMLLARPVIMLPDGFLAQRTLQPCGPLPGVYAITGSVVTPSNASLSYPILVAGNRGRGQIYTDGFPTGSRITFDAVTNPNVGGV
jgi:hypothetical protein